METIMNETALLELENGASVVEVSARQLKDYQLTFEDQIWLRSQAEIVRQHGQTAVLHVIEAGKALLDVTDRFPTGVFLSWLREEVGIPRTTAYKWMALARNEERAKQIHEAFGRGMEDILILISSQWPEDVQLKLLAGESVEIDGVKKTLHELTREEILKVRKQAQEAESRNKDLSTRNRELEATVKTLRTLEPEKIEVTPPDYEKARKENETLRRSNEHLQNRIATLEEEIQGRRKSFEQEARAEILRIQGRILSSVWPIEQPFRYAGNPDWEESTPAQVVEQIVAHWSGEGNVVLDPMAGSGTTVDVCKIMNRQAWCSDLSPRHEAVEVMDAASLEIKDGDVDLVFVHPPIPVLVKKDVDPDSERETNLGKLDRPNYRVVFGSILSEIKRVLRPNGYFAVYAQEFDCVQSGYFDFARFLSEEIVRHGFIEVARAVVLLPDRGQPKAYEPYMQSEGLKPDHANVMVFKGTYAV
jgi:cell division protein FtsB